MKQGKILTRAEILAADDAPRRSGAGRPRKWTAAQVDAERAAAIAVELVRIERGIPPSNSRTPEEIYIQVAAQRGSTKRSIRRHYQKHRQHAAQWARIILESPKWRKRYAELIEAFGHEIGTLQARLVDRIHAAWKSATPTELIAIEDLVRRIIGQKQ